jgi:hypothetical protein
LGEVARPEALPNTCISHHANDRGRADGGITTIEGIGSVVRVQKDPPGMGVVFKELSSYSKKLIERLLTQQMSDEDDL